MIISALRTPTAPVARATTAPTAEPQDTFTRSQDEVPLNIQKSLAAVGKVYYDEARDKADVARYYQDLPAEMSGAERYDALKTLVSRTHTTRFGFDPEKRLFPWIDLRPNLRLQSIYSTEQVTAESPIQNTGKRDFVHKIKVPAPGRPRANGTVGPTRMVNKKTDLREQAATWNKILAESPTDALAIAQKIAMVEGRRYYNAEHSVPQFFFDKAKVPKGDLHHLFTCERFANSLRGCRPYMDIEHTPENRGKEGWGPKHVNGFEPDAGKGAVARAALYFLTRYPGMIGDQEGEYGPKDIETLLRWHKEDPVSLHELHRNQAIAEVQGNRNPFIDHPEWAEQVDFSAAFYDPAKA